MVNLIDLLQQRIEIFRLEQRYTKRRNRRSTFVSDALYVDGEYIYSPTSSPSTSSYSAKCSAAGNSDSEASEAGSKESDTASKEVKASRRLSRMGLDRMDWRRGREEKQAREQARVSVREVKWDSSVRAWELARRRWNGIVRGVYTSTIPYLQGMMCYDFFLGRAWARLDYGLLHWTFTLACYSGLLSFLCIPLNLWRYVSGVVPKASSLFNYSLHAILHAIHMLLPLKLMVTIINSPSELRSDIDIPMSIPKQPIHTVNLTVKRRHGIV